MYDAYMACPSKLNNIFKNKVIVPTIVRKLFELYGLFEHSLLFANIHDVTHSF